MRALVLFKGTGSIDKALEAVGFQVQSLDIDPKCNATWTTDIMDWECPLEPGSIDYIWASPLCTEYSRALTTRPRKMELADRLVKRTLEIIERLQPQYWTLENPGSGELKNREFMKGLPYKDVCYCRYGYPYLKWTRLWGNAPFVPRPMCTRKNPCEQSESGRHPTVAQRGTSRGRPDISYSVNQLYSIPPSLCDDIVAALLAALVTSLSL